MEKELRKIGAYIVVAKRWGSDQSHNYIVDLCKGIDEAKAFKAIDSGKKKISFKMIMNVIRWEIFLKVEEPTLFSIDGKVVKFKINDAYGSRYARMFIDEHPKHSDKIELRRLRA